MSSGGQQLLNGIASRFKFLSAAPKGIVADPPVIDMHFATIFNHEEPPIL